VTAGVDHERELLTLYLTRQREHVIGALDGLDDEDMRKAVLPSGWSPVGLVAHLAVDVERFWFRDVFAGQPATYEWDDAWHPPETLRPADVTDLYRSEIAKSDAIIAASSLETGCANWPERWPNWRFDDLRDLILHVITETCVHAGHLDVVRELLDGKQWMVL
jgi:hypothetical protein